MPLSTIPWFNALFARDVDAPSIADMLCTRGMNAVNTDRCTLSASLFNEHKYDNIFFQSMYQWWPTAAVCARYATHPCDMVILHRVLAMILGARSDRELDATLCILAHITPITLASYVRSILFSCKATSDPDVSTLDMCIMSLYVSLSPAKHDGGAAPTFSETILLADTKPDYMLILAVILNTPILVVSDLDIPLITEADSRCGIQPSPWRFIDISIYTMQKKALSVPGCQTSPISDEPLNLLQRIGLPPQRHAESILNWRRIGHGVNNAALAGLHVFHPQASVM